MTDKEPVVILHILKVTCEDEKDHDWSGPGYERELPGGAFESGATCAKCGIEFGHYALHTFD